MTPLDLLYAKRTAPRYNSSSEELYSDIASRNKFNFSTLINVKPKDTIYNIRNHAYFIIVYNHPIDLFALRSKCSYNYYQFCTD